jgi:hypothetical protein
MARLAEESLNGGAGQFRVRDKSGLSLEESDLI